MLSAAFGIGGAVLSTPGVRLLGASALVAVGTTLPSILPSAATGTARYWREGLVERRVVAVVAPVGVVTAVAGSLASHEVPGEGHWLMVLTAVLVGITAVRLGRGTGSPEAGPGVVRPRLGQRGETIGAVALGLVAGFLSGLLGVGGGVILLPGFLEVLRLPVKSAIATSLACVGVLAVPATVAHAFLGDIDWRLALLLAVAVVPGARLGAALAIRASDRRLRLAVAAVLGAIALVYGITELRSALR
jgi:uncharacterized membrane protein YfcA